MNRQFLLFAVLFSCYTLAQNTIKGVVVDSSGSPLANVSVRATPSKAYTHTAEDGSFSLSVNAPQTLTFLLNEFEPYIVTARVSDVLLITLQHHAIEEDIYENTALHIINLNDDELNTESDTRDNISGVLQSSKDVFLRTAAFEFSSSFFSLRGLDSQNTAVLINGIPMNKLHNGRPQWSNWGGLNDVLRNQEFTHGTIPSDYTVDGVLGTTNINTRASQYAKGGRVTASTSNRSYNFRILGSYGTGQLKNGWSAAFAIGNRWGISGYQKGTFSITQAK